MVFIIKGRVLITGNIKRLCLFKYHIVYIFKHIFSRSFFNSHSAPSDDFIKYRKHGKDNQTAAVHTEISAARDNLKQNFKKQYILHKPYKYIAENLLHKISYHQPFIGTPYQSQRIYYIFYNRHISLLLINLYKSHFSPPKAKTPSANRQRFTASLRQ